VIGENATGNVLSWCAGEITVPGLDALQCIPEGTTTVLIDDDTGQWQPDPPLAELRVRMVLDTILLDCMVEIDLSGSNYLALRAGESAVRGPLLLRADESERYTWELELTDVPAGIALDTIAYRVWAGNGAYESRCERAVRITRLVEGAECTVTGPDSLTEADVRIGRTEYVEYALTNTGTVPVEVDRHEFTIDGGAGLEILGPATHSGEMLAAGATASMYFVIRALALAEDRTANCTVTSYDVSGDVLARCTHEIFVEAIDDELHCGIAAVDVIRFDRTRLIYDPDPVDVIVTLRNPFDVPEHDIEVRIDLTEADRLTLAQGETQMKSQSLLEARGEAGFTWQLQPLAGPDDAQQQITVRYRSAEQSAWQECMTTVLIEAWPEERTLRCATGGHDTLWADAAYERMIPDELTISYAVTNTGTVPLTACAATIVLPPQFALLAGEEATKDYGDLAPGESRERWWHIEETAELSDFTAYDITWQWRSNEQGTTDGCTHVLHVVPHASTGLVLTPLHMHFEAERNEALPAAQELRLWTGGGLSMPWTAAGDAWWLAADPASGDRASVLAVRPVSTDLPIGLHATALRLAGQAPNLPREIPVTYEITGIVSAGEIPAPGAFGLSAIWPQPVPMQGEARLALRVHPGEHVRLTLHDALGRQVAVLHDDVFAKLHHPDSASLLRGIGRVHREHRGLFRADLFNNKRP
jgi:hypothetical protein